uniref:Carboxylic ester hydrolase n=1 Tax=Glossina austeni TaxID=7395 RepID=A0A1A9V9V1_GLOAU
MIYLLEFIYFLFYLYTVPQQYNNEDEKEMRTLENKILTYRLSTNEHPLAETEYGKIKGIKRNSIYGDLYYSFEGIPYAQPPLGELRFKAPQRPTPWDGIKDCTTHRDKSVQYDFVTGKICGSEDCLYLNVYTNNLSPESQRPVLVFIHGGGFIYGEANHDWYGPAYFMRKDVVLVTIQYRLGVLGFLSLNTESLNVPGNAGLKDQVLALKWIKNNCSRFGGNPDCITIFGQSAGGASTNYLMMSEQTRGLFHRAILQSGNVLCPWAYTLCQQRAFLLAQLLGYKGDVNDKDVYEFLTKAKPYDLFKYQEKVLTAEDAKNNVMFAFGPTLEPYVTSECFMNKQLREMLKTGWGNSIPTMLGNTSYEGLFFRARIMQNPKLVDILDTCVTYVPDGLADTERSSPETLELGKKIKTIHNVDEKPTSDKLMEIAGYSHFLFPMHRLLHIRFQHSTSAPVYLYRFDFDTEELITPYRIMRWGRGVKGVAHADDLAFLFSNILARRMTKDSREYKTIERMIDIWTQFATTGNPYNSDIQGLEDIVWEPLNKNDNTYKCLNIGDELKFIDLPEMENLKQWENLYENQKNLF